MHPKAISKAESRLRVMRKAANELAACADLNAFSDSWYTFLIAAKNIYTVLEQGAKSSPQSRQWFGAKAAQRRADALLQYLYEARNDEEHGLGDMARQMPGHIGIGTSGPGLAQRIVVNGSFAHGLRVESLDGKPVGVEVVPPHVRLLPIKARGGRILHPPTSHLGSTLPDTSPLGVAKVALSYLESLVSEAARLA